MTPATPSARRSCRGNFTRSVFVTRLEDKVASLGKANSQLVDDLKKREAVLERLRELTLGQLED